MTVEPKKLELLDNYISVRFRPPSQFTAFRNPDWAAHAATKMYRGIARNAFLQIPWQGSDSQIEVTMGKTKAGNWYIQRMLFPIVLYPELRDPEATTDDIPEEMVEQIAAIAMEIAQQLEGGE